MVGVVRLFCLARVFVFIFPMGHKRPLSNIDWKSRCLSTDNNIEDFY